MFEWDEAKRLRVLQERGIDFEDARQLLDGRPAIHLLSSRNDEVRVVSTAAMRGKLYTVVWTWRELNQRIITIRRARNAEERAYRQVYG
jgi:uncharacterized protein